MNRVTIFPQWGGYKIKVDNKTVGAAPSGNLDRALELAKMQAKNINENEIDLLDQNQKIINTYKV